MKFFEKFFARATPAPEGLQPPISANAFRGYAGATPVSVDLQPVSEPKDLPPVGDGRHRKKIMVVDDDPVVLKSLSMALESKGYKVVTASDGSEAIGRLRDEGADMMLVDVNFPADSSSWDGFRITQWIRYTNRGLPTIMMSGSYKPDYEKQAAAVGAEAFMVKPVDTRRLLGAITKVLGTGADAGSALPILKGVGNAQPRRFENSATVQRA